MSKKRHGWPTYAPNRAGGYITIGVGGCLALLFLGILVMIITAIIPMGIFLLAAGQISDHPEVLLVGILLAVGLAIWSVLSVVALVGVGGGLIWWGLRSLRHAKQLDEGPVASGVITNRWRRPHGGVGLTYKFTPWGTSEEITVTQYDWWVYQRYQIGDAVQVRYLADNPKICRLEEPET